MSKYIDADRLKAKLDEHYRKYQSKYMETRTPYTQGLVDAIDLAEGGGAEEIRNAFIEFSEFPCPFQDCTHTKEGECCVKKAVLENHILESRYLNYLSFIGADHYEKS